MSLSDLIMQSPHLFSGHEALEAIYPQELSWLERVLEARAQLKDPGEGTPSDWVPPEMYTSLLPPSLSGESSYANFLGELKAAREGLAKEEEATLLGIAERMTLLMALLPHLSPRLLRYFREVESQSSQAINSVQGHLHGTFIPCPETVLYTLAGNNLHLRLLFQKVFSTHHLFHRKRVFESQQVPTGVPWLKGALHLSPEYLYLFTFGQEYEPEHSKDFPAQKLTTKLRWDDLVVPLSTHKKIQELLDWVKYFEKMAQHPEFSRERTGYRCLLVGEPGTGKTMLGRLLSKETERPVYRLSLDRIVSKYVGETTKNIARVFHTARNRNWILFCDEGDALFSKRSTKTQGAQDTFVNQDIAFLLQEIEDYPGIILVASNYSTNMDRAFQRRFDTRIDFKKPEHGEILSLWHKALDVFQLDPELDLNFVAHSQKGKITGAQITKVKHFLGLQAMKLDNWELTVSDFCEGLRQVNLEVPDFEGRKERMNRYHSS